MAFDYDLFISYSSFDLAWAQRLYDDIRKYNQTQPAQDQKIRCYFDKRSLREGSEFPAQLRNAARNSQHLLIIWSDTADRSAWVRQGKAEFRASFDSDTPANILSARRRLLMVVLEGDDTTEHDLQKFFQIRDVGDYKSKTPAGLDALTQQAWDSVVRSVTSVKRPQPEVVTIPLTVVGILGPDPLEAEKNIRLLSQGLSVIVVDPLSLYEPYVAKRFSWLSKCFDNENAIVFSPPPFQYEPLRYLRNQSRFLGMPNFDRYFDPPVPTTRRMAQCSLALTDEQDMERMLLAGLGAFVPTATRTPKPAVLAMGNP